jgi:hypothetical protein
MNSRDKLVAALRYYNIDVVGNHENFIQLGRGFTIEIESNGIYKLFADRQVIAPFDDLDELCNFILM